MKSIYVYKDQLSDKRWLDKRKEILNRDKHKCIICSNNKNLHIHHILYKPKRKAWQYSNELLVTLCSKCHYGFHHGDRFKSIVKNELNPYMKETNTSDYSITATTLQENKVNIYMTADVRKIYLKLSSISNYLLRYIEGNLQYNQDVVYINTRKFMEEAEIKSRTTFYKGIEELCKYGFISHYHKQNSYWINPFRFFNGDRIKKYSNNLNNLSE